MDTARIQEGDELRCPHCRQWHRIFHLHTGGTDYSVSMLYFDCPRQHEGHYFAGSRGTPCRFPTRRPLSE